MKNNDFKDFDLSNFIELTEDQLRFEVNGGRTKSSSSSSSSSSRSNSSSSRGASDRGSGTSSSKSTGVSKTATGKSGNGSRIKSSFSNFIQKIKTLASTEQKKKWPENGSNSTNNSKNQGFSTKTDSLITYGDYNVSNGKFPHALTSESISDMDYRVDASQNKVETTKEQVKETSRNVWEERRKSHGLSFGFVKAIAKNQQAFSNKKKAVKENNDVKFYEKRKLLNISYQYPASQGYLPTYDQIIQNSSWQLQSSFASQEHQNNKGAPELKFVNTDKKSPDFGKEAVYTKDFSNDGGYQLYLDPRYEGTYNYKTGQSFSRENISLYGIGNIMKSWLDHGKDDLLPYYLHEKKNERDQ